MANIWQKDINNHRDILFILHDQLNLQVFPPSILQRRPLIVLVESFAYASFLAHHQMKLAFIWSCQRHFALELEQQGYDVLTLSTKGWHSEGIKQIMTDYSHLSLFYMEPNEWQTREQMKELKSLFPDRVFSFSNNFFLTDVKQYVSKINKNYRLESFYRDLRKQTGYLMAEGKPIGGKWNYDKDNRKALPKKITIPAVTKFTPDTITETVITEIKANFAHHFGKLDQFPWAVNRQQALQLAREFMIERLPYFGAYEDAIKTDEPFLFHSVLSPYLNNGLLLPAELCQMAIESYKNGQAPLNSVEGFIRQIIGWREYIRVYYEAMMPDVRESNHFGFTLNLPQLFWDGKTELKCLADAIKNVIELGYSHHIQRLMVLSNFSNLTMTNPIELSHWFWLAYIDAYEWVELPNVLGMSTYADGGILASKPYISGGNYIHKMSNCCSQCHYDVKQKTGKNACPFNYLYWHFIDRYRQDFKENGRVSLMVQMFDKKTDSEKEEIARSARDFIEKIPRYSSVLPQQDISKANF
ncbi:MAG: cryptochrome/photolyase family protein [Cyanobacteria bacterium M5B4]|nr:MAG: cryptochrome/photolyase family protein [Cyanobacteria bacterium M5B4]